MDVAALPPWTAAAPAVAAAAGVLLVPGLVVGLALRATGLRLWALAPALSATLVAVGAVLADALGVPWTPWVPGLLAALVVVLLAVLQAGVQRWRREGRAAAGGHAEAGRRRRSAGWLATAGLLLGAVLAAAQLTAAVSSPALVGQGTDVVHHLNSVRYALDTGSASSLTIGLMDSGSGFYPAAWHGVVSLVAQLSGATLPVCTNAVSLVVSAVVWPAGSALLAAQVLPRSSVVPMAAGVLSAAFPVFPHLLLIWGIVYPAFLATALLPVALALALAALGRGEPASPTGRAARGAVLAVGVLPGLALAHPSAGGALLVLGLPSALAAAGGGLRRLARRPRGRLLVVLALAAASAVAGALLAAVLSSSLVSSVSRFPWPPRATAAQATGEVLLGVGPGGGDAVWWASLLVLVGAVRLVLLHRSRALVVGGCLAAALYVIAQSTTTNVLTGLWYNDSHRVAVLVTVVAVPLAAVGAAAVVAALPARVARLRRRRPVDDEPGAATGAPGTTRGRARTAVAALAVLALCLGAVLLPGDGRESSRRALDVAYGSDRSDAQLLDRAELRLLARVPGLVPEGDVVAVDPYDGGELVYALADRKALSHRRTPSARLAEERLDEVGTSPEVCDAVRDEGVRYALVLGNRFGAEADAARAYDGVASLDDLWEASREEGGADAPVRLLAQEGAAARLFELTACAGGIG